MAAITWTEETHFRLREIFDYIASDNPAATAKVVEDIYERAQVLTDFPRIGHR
jgi:toxin ParE1/3/4